MRNKIIAKAWEKYHTAVHARAVRSLKRLDLADEATAATFEAVCKYCDTKTGIHGIGAYALKTVDSKIIEVVRDKNYWHQSIDWLEHTPAARERLDEYLGNEQDLETVEKRVDIHAALEHIPVILCRLIRMRYVDVLTLREIAELQGVASPQTVLNYLRATCEEIAPYLTGYESEQPGAGVRSAEGTDAPGEARLGVAA